MARYYHVDIARFAANADHKWLDNLLSHFAIPGVESARQGLARKISDAGIYHITLIRELTRNLGMTVPSAVFLAERLLGANGGMIELGNGLRIELDRSHFQGAVDRAIAEAVESVTPVRRGRPKRREHA